MTSGGDSNFKRIFFVVLKKYSQSGKASLNALSALIYKILAKAHEEGIKSIAIPPLGTGVLKIPIGVCVEAMQNGFAKYIREHKHKMVCKIVDICIFDEKTYDEFEKIWKEKLGEESKDDSDDDDMDYSNRVKGVKKNTKLNLDSDDSEELKRVSKGVASKYTLKVY